jgi:hypothetical protein
MLQKVNFNGEVVMAKSKRHTVWHGHIKERAYLLWCIDVHCTCTPGRSGWAHGRCDAHDLLADQRTLDNLATTRARRAEMLEAEGLASARPPLGASRAAGEAPPIFLLPQRTIAACAIAALLLIGSLNTTWTLPASPPAAHPIAGWQSR